jgi:predicted permease
LLVAGRQELVKHYARRATLMATTARLGNRLGIVQMYALVFGIAYLGVAVLEDVFGSSGLKIGGVTILQVQLVQNLIHWVVGLAVLGSFFAGEDWAKMVARIVGLVFVLVTLLGFFVEPLTGQLLGFPDALPLSYNLVHLLTAAAALFAGFAAQRAYGQT